MLQTFYRCYIESTLTFGFLAWQGGLSVTNSNTLTKTVNISSKVIGKEQESLNDLYNTRAERKGRQIASDPDHPLNSRYCLLPSGRHYRTPLLHTNRSRNSFVPRSLKLLNKQKY